MNAPLLIGSEIYRRSTYGPKHPLAIPRVSTTLDLIRAYYQLSERPRRRLLDLAKSLHGGLDHTDAA